MRFFLVMRPGRMFYSLLHVETHERRFSVVCVSFRCVQSA
jgi:hypothetical protein